MSSKVKMDPTQVPPPPIYEAYDAQTQVAPQQTGGPYQQPFNPPSRQPTLTYADPHQDAMPTTNYQPQGNVYPTQPMRGFSMPPPVMEAHPNTFDPPQALTYQQQQQGQQQQGQQQQGQQGTMGPMRSNTYPMQSPAAEKEWAPEPPPKAQRTYQTAIPLQNLGPGSAPVDCPVCGERRLTAINYTSGGKTHLWALVFCFTVGLGCIPYLMESMKDVKHNCGGCGVWLATYLRGGSTVVHQHA